MTSSLFAKKLTICSIASLNDGEHSAKGGMDATVVLFSIFPALQETKARSTGKSVLRLRDLALGSNPMPRRTISYRGV
jgi:hypothetical protein